MKTPRLTKSNVRHEILRLRKRICDTVTMTSEELWFMTEELYEAQRDYQMGQEPQLIYHGFVNDGFDWRVETGEPENHLFRKEEDAKKFIASRSASSDLVERLKDEQAWNLQKQASDYLATEPDDASQRFREAKETYKFGYAGGCTQNLLNWRGQRVWVIYDVEFDDNGRPCYLLNAIYDQDWMSVVEQVTSSELDDLERRLFNLDNFSRMGF